jgi:hypothetical protein
MVLNSLVTIPRVPAVWSLREENKKSFFVCDCIGMYCLFSSGRRQAEVGACLLSMEGCRQVGRGIDLFLENRMALGVVGLVSHFLHLKSENARH